VCYSFIALLIFAGWSSVRVGFTQAAMISAICFGALLAAALRLGSLSFGHADIKVQEEKKAVLSGNVQPSAAGFIS
jgi:hypothetical protein